MRYSQVPVGGQYHGNARRHTRCVVIVSGEPYHDLFGTCQSGKASDDRFVILRYVSVEECVYGNSTTAL